MATERWCPPVQPTATTSAVFPSSTYLGQEKAHQVLKLFQELPGRSAGKHVVPYPVVQAGAGAQLRNIVGVGQKAHVKDQIRL